jgi:hypothetical protein
MWGDMKEIKERWPQFFATRAEGGIEYYCGPGWYPMIYSAFEAIERQFGKDASFKAVQIKEKFGNLRIYYRSGEEGIDQIIEQCCRFANTACEFCGTTLGVECKSWANWVKTLCQECGPRYRDGWRPWANETCDGCGQDIGCSCKDFKGGE